MLCAKRRECWGYVLVAQPGEGFLAARSLDPTRIWSRRRRPAGGTILRDLASLELKRSLILARISNATPSLPACLDGFALYSEAF